MITRNSKNEIILNVKEFKKKQYCIWSKYEEVDNVLLFNITEKQFINLLDRYIMQVLEEIVETETEFEENGGIFNKEYLLEVIDTMMYLVTILDILDVNICTYQLHMGVVNNTYIPESNIIIEHQEFPYNVQDQLFKIVSNLMNIRRLYSARKWHKPHIILTNEQYLETLINTYKLISDSISITLRMLVHEDIEYINKLIRDKHEFIVNL